MLAALVVVSLILLTAAFGSAGGGTTGGVAGPLVDGVSTIVKPVRDLVNWVGDTADAKQEVADRKREANQLRAENARLLDRLRRIPKLAQLQKLDDRLQLSPAAPVAADVIVQSPSQWALTVTIDRGSNDGISVGDPVIGADADNAGLVGFVRNARGGQAVVALLPDQSVAIGARLAGKDPIGIITGAGAGTTTDLELSDIPSTVAINPGMLVTTSGSARNAGELASLAPPGIPIGRVTSVDQGKTDDQIAHVRPLVALRSLETVRVLTQSVNGNRPQ